MKQAFVLPLPKYSSFCAAEIKSQDDEKEQIALWHTLLDKLSDQKISWAYLDTYLPELGEERLMHPVVRTACDRNGQSLLHLAVLQEEMSWVRFLASDPYLKRRRNHFGLAPFELARLLHKNSYAALLSSAPDLYNGEANVDAAEGTENFTPISCPIFDNEEILAEVLELSRKAKSQDKIPPEKIWMGIYFDKEIQTGLNPRLSVRYIDEEVGYGVFAQQRIPSCSFVGEYVGIIRERKAQLLKDKIYCMRYNVWQTARRQFIIDAETHGNYTRFINHSARPNLALQSVYWRGLPRMVFISLQEIPEGTQLTFDYGRSFWKQREPRCLIDF